MRKVFYILFFIISFFILINLYNKDYEIKTNKKPDEEKLKGVFISYIDYSILKGKDADNQKKLISQMVQNVNDFGFNSIILQVRSFSDAIYYSKYFHPSRSITDNELEFDVLEQFINEAKKYNIKLLAWINPYRISSSNDISCITEDDYYYKYINTNKIQVSNGIYFNPADSDVLSLIIKGVEEVLSYDVDGIIYDDYFYPNETIDLENFNKEENISLKEYRINNINNLIRETYETVKKKDKNLLFGISPSGNMENNINQEYLDVNYIVENKLVDFLIPQLYYGFENSSKPYVETLNEWNKLNTDIYVALSLYKSGGEDKYAGDGKHEWINNTDIIKRQIENSNDTKGFFIFRYYHIFNYVNDQMQEEVKNLKSITK